LHPGNSGLGRDNHAAGDKRRRRAGISSLAWENCGAGWEYVKLMHYFFPVFSAVFGGLKPEWRMLQYSFLIVQQKISGAITPKK
jgi:hypothetical protein